MYNVELIPRKTVTTETSVWGDDSTTTMYSVKVNGKTARRYRGSTSRQCFLWRCPNTSQKFIIKLDQLLPDVGHTYDSQSSDEISMLNDIEEEDKEYFPEIIAHGFDNGVGYVIQPYYKFISFDETTNNSYSDLYSEILRVAEKYNIGDVEPWWHNCGITKEGRAIIYDFGI